MDVEYTFWQMLHLCTSLKVVLRIMGITRVLVKNVFSKNKHALSSQDSSVMSCNGASKKRWSSVRSYLCGHEFNSVNAEVDSASVNGSEASITQPLVKQLIEKDNKESESIKENVPNSKKKSISKLFHEENAAIIIQSAFRDYLARRQRNEKQSQEINKGGEEKEEITPGQKRTVLVGTRWEHQ